MISSRIASRNGSLREELAGKPRQADCLESLAFCISASGPNPCSFDRWRQVRYFGAETPKSGQSISFVLVAQLPRCGYDFAFRVLCGKAAWAAATWVLQLFSSGQASWLCGQMLVSRRYYCEKSNDRHPIVAFSGRTLHGPSAVKHTDPEGI